MISTSKSYKIWLTCLILVLILKFLFFIWDGVVYDMEYDKISTGMTKQEVEKLLGEPTQVTDCTTTYGGYKRTAYDSVPQDCSQEYWYYAHFLPEAWSYTFNKDNKLIYKYHWGSP